MNQIKVVSIMDYPREPRFLRMGYMFLDSVLAHGAASVTLLYERHKPVVAPEHRRRADVEVVQGRSYDVGHWHFNLRFKLPNLASLSYPFLYLDADMFVLDDLDYLWQRRQCKPWIGINHQRISTDARTLRSPFLNSGLQLVSDPAFYDLDAILKAQNLIAPLARHREIPPRELFICPGHDQAVLFQYFQTIAYDYTHPEIGTGWNSCAGVTAVRREGDSWRARTFGLADDHDVRILHYWSQFKPWSIGCPIYNSYAWVDDYLRQLP
jgi:hypothetical protein